MRKLAYAIGLLATVVCVWFFAERVASHWSSLRHFPFTLDVVGWLAAATVIYLGTFVSATASWRSCLAIFRQRVAFVDCLHVNMISQFAKFLPGNVGQHIGRVLMMRGYVQSGTAVVSSIILDMAILAGIALLLSLLNLPLALTLLGQHATLPQPSSLALAITAVSTGGMVALLWRFYPGTRNMIRDFLSSRNIVLSPAEDACSVLQASLWHVVSFTIGAGAVCCIILGLTHAFPVSYPSIVGAYSLAWLAGFLLPGAPAGLGVREAVLVLAIGPGVGDETATVTALLLRVATTLGDGAALATGLVVRRLRAAQRP